MIDTVELALVLAGMLTVAWIAGTILGRWHGEILQRRWRRKRDEYKRKIPAPCCSQEAHGYCMACLDNGHVFGAWVPQRLFAFEERVCACCGHAEARVLPLGEEDV